MPNRTWVATEHPEAVEKLRSDLQSELEVHVSKKRKPRVRYRPLKKQIRHGDLESLVSASTALGVTVRVLDVADDGHVEIPEDMRNVAS